MATIFGSSGNNTLIAEGDNLRGLGGNDTYLVTNRLSNNPANPAGLVVITDTEGSNRLQFADGLQISRVDFLGGNAIQLTLSNNTRIQVLGADRFTYDVGGNTAADDFDGLIGRSFSQLAADFGVTLNNGSGSSNRAVTVQAGAAPLGGSPPPPPELPEISIFGTTFPAFEGNSGNAIFTFTLERQGNTSGSATVNFNVTGTGTNPVNAADFAGGVLPSGVVTFAAGETRRTVEVNVRGDTTVEANETFTFTLSSPSGARLGQATTLSATVNNDDAGNPPPPPTPPQVSVESVQSPFAEGNSGNSVHTFTLVRTGNIDVASSVNYTVAGSGTNAVNGSDFAGGVLPSGVANFAAGQVRQTVQVNVLGDTTVEANESFSFTLSAPTGATLGTPSSVVATVVNDDSTGGADDFASSTNTTGRVVVGGTASGVLEVVGDRDWFAVDLVAGQTYRFSQTANNDGFDTFLRLRNSSGTELASDDDGGAGLNSTLVFTATTTSRHFIDAGSFDDQSAGGYSVSVAAAPPPPPEDRSRFNITLDYSGPEQYRSFFSAAATRLEQVIFADLPSDTYNGVFVDDILITSVLEEIDGVGGVLAQAGPDQLRGGARPLPVHGGMLFDTADADRLIAEGGFAQVVLHEMLHVLGFGTLWETYGFNDTFGRYTGAIALQEYRREFSPGATFIPLETGGGSGSANAHWDDDLFFGEVMGAFYTRGEAGALSRITVAALEDLGYGMDYSGADPFTFNPRQVANQSSDTNNGVDGVLIAQPAKVASFFSDLS